MCIRVLLLFNAGVWVSYRKLAKSAVRTVWEVCTYVQDPLFSETVGLPEPIIYLVL